MPSPDEVEQELGGEALALVAVVSAGPGEQESPPAPEESPAGRGNPNLSAEISADERGLGLTSTARSAVEAGEGG